MSVLKQISDTFWSESVWLPPGKTWADIANPPHAISSDVLYAFPISVFLLFLRLPLEKYCMRPIGIYLGLQGHRLRKHKRNKILEKAYLSNPNLNHDQVVYLAKRLDYTERQIERWWRLRHNQDRPTKLTKFCECFWKFLFYFYNIIIGIFVVSNKSWLWDIDNCFVDYPHHSMTGDVWWYYMISMAFYWSLVFSHFFEVRRKDFWQMFIHHLATIALLNFSWICNFHRIGTLVLLTHDISDVILEFAKMAKYANYQKVCDTLFGVFTLSWLLTRTGIYPFHILRATTMRSMVLLPMFPVYYIFNGLLCVLMVLHLFWTWMILKMIYRLFLVGEVEEDIRSSNSEFSDSSHSSDISSDNKLNVVPNGKQNYSLHNKNLNRINQ